MATGGERGPPGRGRLGSWRLGIPLRPLWLRRREGAEGCRESRGQARAAARDSTLAAGPARRVAGKEELQVKSASTSGTTETVRRRLLPIFPRQGAAEARAAREAARKVRPRPSPRLSRSRRRRPKAPLSLLARCALSSRRRGRAGRARTVTPSRSGVPVCRRRVLWWGPSALCWCSGGRARPAQNGGTPTSAPGLVKSAFL